MDVNIGRRGGKVLTEDASGAQYKYLFSRDGDTLTLDQREKTRADVAEIPEWQLVTPTVTESVRDELERRGYDVE